MVPSRPADPAASEPERDFYIWEDGDYVAWLGVPSLPKLNHHNAALRHRIFERPRGVVRKWLGRAGGLDGWRVDVANMTGRWRETDLNHEVARQMRDVDGRGPRPTRCSSGSTSTTTRPTCPATAGTAS